MKLTNFTDYSLRVLIYLGVRRELRSTVTEIATKYNISNAHLVKVVHNLAKLGLINSYKGKGGGISLALDSKDINIGKTIRTLEEDTVLVDCFSEEGQCKLNPGCQLKSALLAAKKSFYETLESYTLEDMLKNKSTIKKQLEI